MQFTLDSVTRPLFNPRSIADILSTRLTKSDALLAAIQGLVSAGRGLEAMKALEAMKESVSTFIDDVGKLEFFRVSM